MSFPAHVQFEHMDDRGLLFVVLNRLDYLLDRIEHMSQAIDREELANRFTYHAPKDDQPTRYVKLREKALELAEMIRELTPNSREQSLAFTNLEQASFWANAAIARNE